MIYMDNAATTRTAPEVVEAMLPYFSDLYGNPSSIYRLAGKSKAALTKSREQTAALIGARAEEIFFTSGGSEADNWAVKAAFESFSEKGKHIITTKIEHPAVLRTCEYLERERGARVTYLDVDENGRVDPERVEAAIAEDTILISVMFANNEIGTIEPIAEIGDIAHRHGILFHTDAVQAYAQIPIDVDEMHIDLLSASGHKFNGPKGIGLIYIRRGTGLRAFLHGGAQEKNRRAGTENVPAIVGIGAAAERARIHMEHKIRTELELRDYMIAEIRKNIPYVKLNGQPDDGTIPGFEPDPSAETGEATARNLVYDTKNKSTNAVVYQETFTDKDGNESEVLRYNGTRLPNNVNFSFAFVEGESLLIMLDMKEVCASSGSACASGSLSPSHVLKAIGLSDSLARGALRFTLSEENTKEEIDNVVRESAAIVKRLRAMSPKYEAFLKGDGNVE